MKSQSICALLTLAISCANAQAQPQALHPPQSLPERLSLRDAEELLLQRNLAIAGSRQQIEVTEALRKVVGLKPNPTLQFGAEQIPFVSPIAGSVPRLFATNPDAGANPVYTAQLGRLIERGGKRELRVQQAEALVDVAKAQLTDTFRQQLLQLRQAFTNAFLAKDNLKFAEEVERQYRDIERAMEARLLAGDIAKVDLQRVQVARLPYQQAVIDARAAYSQAARDIATILSAPGAAPSSVQLRTSSIVLAPTLELMGDLNVTPVLPALEELRVVALRERPDLSAAQSIVRAAERGTRLAEAQKVRDLYTAVEYQRVGNDHSVGATVSFPLFLYNNQKAGIAQAVAQERLNSLQSRQLEQQVLADVDKAYQVAIAALQVLNLYSAETLARSLSIREMVNYSYVRGEASLLELIEAQRSAAQTLLLNNQAKATYLNAYWLLQAAVGKPF